MKNMKMIAVALMMGLTLLLTACGCGSCKKCCDTDCKKECCKDECKDMAACCKEAKAAGKDCEKCKK